MNVRDAVEQRAARHGWKNIVADEDSEIWARGGDRVVIRYKMFGTPNNYMLRYYGHAARYAGINWGIETAFHGDQPVTGKNKKGQVLRILATKVPKRKLRWHGPMPDWHHFAQDEQVMYKASRAYGGGWSLDFGWHSGVEPQEHLGWYKKLAEAKNVSREHYEKLGEQ